MRTLFSAILVFLLLSASAFSQVIVPSKDQPTELERDVFGLGASFGLGTGMGLSFRHHLPSIASYQFTAGIIKDSKKLVYDLGLEIQFDLVRGESTRFYAGGGSGFYYVGETSNELEGPLRLAAGIGIESKAREALHFSASLYFTFFTNGQIFPLPQFGIHYYFF
ncbi:MAG: hypothetical protein Q8K98_05510 [Bacteroidota bacterium]|nr:hypothetical protein [Bacteroidota bacterium]